MGKMYIDIAFYQSNLFLRVIIVYEIYESNCFRLNKFVTYVLIFI